MYASLINHNEMLYAALLLIQKLLIVFNTCEEHVFHSIITLA